MLTGWTPFHSFWSSAWAAALRGTCSWLEGKPRPAVPETPDALAPNWIRPLWLQRTVGKAIAARVQRMRTHPNCVLPLSPEGSRPLWTVEGWTPYARARLRGWSEDEMLAWFYRDVERLLRIVILPPRLVGEVRWTRAALGSCEHVAQIYHELRRRYSARVAREAVCRALEMYIVWERREEPTRPVEPQAGD